MPEWDLAIDVESRNTVPKALEERGAFGYWAMEETVPLCLCAVDVMTGEEFRFDLRYGIPQEMVRLLNSYFGLVAHNVSFEYSMFYHKLRQHGVNLPRVWTDTMDIAAYMHAPLSLAGAAEFLLHDSEASQKDMAGRRVMHELCIATPTRLKKWDPWLTDISDEKYKQLEDYCLQDAKVSKELFAEGIQYIPENEQDEMQRTFQMNTRGIPISRPMATRLSEMYREDVYSLEIPPHIPLDKKDLTRTKYLKDFFFIHYGVIYDSLDKEHVEQIRKDPNTPEDVMTILDMAEIVKATSVKKLEVALNSSEYDSTIKFGFQYHGTATGRLAGRGFQPHNLYKGYKKDADIEAAKVKFNIEV